MEDAQLVPAGGPQLGQHGGVQRRAIRDDHGRLHTPGREIFQEASHVILVVAADQSEGHRQIADRVGGQQQGEASQV
jgi:hypothetical protein